MWNFKNWKAFLLLSIVLPIGLFTTFRFTGVLHAPLTVSQTITAETVTWNMSRPTKNLAVDVQVKNSFENNGILASSNVHVVKYYEDDSGPPAGGNDYLKLMINAEMNVSNGYIHSVVLNFSRGETSALLRSFYEPDYDQFKNLDPKGVPLSELGRNDAYLFYGLNWPNYCLLKIYWAWIFLDSNSVNHAAEITIEIVYYDGNTFREVLMPTKLEVLLS